MNLNVFNQSIADGLHVVAPEIIGAARVGRREDQNGGGDASVAFEHARRQTDVHVEILIFNQKFCGVSRGP
jgi:hypothetical protein